MSTQDERNKMNQNLKDIIPLCCNGDENAEKYLKDIAYASRIIDDLIDQDNPVTDDMIYRAFFILSVEIPCNPFYLHHVNYLTSVQSIAYNAWMDANKWEDGTEGQKKHALVIRDYINELCPLVAFLTGGYESMRQVSLKVRETFRKEA
jgi:hypothetical protein